MRKRRKSHHPLADLRKTRLLSQFALAELADIGERTVSMIERGDVQPKMVTRRKILESLAIPLDLHESIFGDLPKMGRPVRRKRAAA